MEKSNLGRAIHFDVPPDTTSGLANEIEAFKRKAAENTGIPAGWDAARVAQDYLEHEGFTWQDAHEARMKRQQQNGGGEK